jgi:hypothetical protein
MAARKTTAAKTDETATEPEAVKAPRKKREPKPVNDLPSAVAAQKAAQRRYDRAAKALEALKKEESDAWTALQESKAEVKRYYSELMGDEATQADEGTEDHGDHSEYEPEPEPVDESEGAGHNF